MTVLGGAIAAWNRRAASHVPVSVRMLTNLELAELSRERLQPWVWPLNEGIQRKFCEVNGLTIGQPAAQEPVAWFHPQSPNSVVNSRQFQRVLAKDKVGYVPLYAAPVSPVADPVEPVALEATDEEQS